MMKDGGGVEGGLVEKSGRGNGGVVEEEEEEEVAPMRTAETLMRILPMALSLTALLLILKNSQSNDFGAISSSDFAGFKYLIYANGVCAGYSLLSAFYAAVPRSSTISRAWTIFFFDQVFTYVILAAGAASAEIVFLEFRGDASITWSEACGTYGRFCRKAVASVAITFAATVCYAALSLLSSYRLFARYDPPPVSFYPHAKELQVPAFPR
ncbi:CASP-like protein 2A1 [Amborella trichopoda]|uniref:CASP-like protein n=1 Tax=Amborella trichopoda TaxID=13333 RepID=W1NVV4_AMBTC|nr:CASP-like protein 2A1 [Amborella trichopoda]ERM99395.1 hypothetical protein AMTR_s00131p00032340 [Amborella trichopoda]|eukprot:XP_006836542.1 CASP-like protein 2A1 [Amborella trichopoda]